MELCCDLPKMTRIYAVVDGRVDFAGSAPWYRLNLYSTEEGSSFLIYWLHGDWEVVVDRGAQVKQGDLLAVARRPISDEEKASFTLGCGKSLAIGYADVPLPEEIVNLWEE